MDTTGRDVGTAASPGIRTARLPSDEPRNVKGVWRLSSCEKLWLATLKA